MPIAAQGPAQLVVDFTTDPESSRPYNFVSAGDVAFITAFSAKFSRGLWMTDGTADGTTLLKAEGLTGTPVVLGTGNDLAILFSEFDAAGMYGLWSSDGTRSGTVRLFQPSTSPPSAPAVKNGRAYFFADDGVHGRELWRSNGSAQGTTLVKDILPSSASGVPFKSTGPVFVDGDLFFTAADTTPGAADDVVALWKSDGTTEGTQQIKGGFQHTGLFHEPSFGALGLFFFVARHIDGGNGLWRSDGTEGGTALLARTNLTFPAFVVGQQQTPQPMDLGGSILFFSDGSLWTSDGTAEGTFPIRTALLVTGATQLENRFVFTACDYNTFDCGLWVSDGTITGTRIIADVVVDGPVLEPCSDVVSLAPPSFVTIGERAYFFADGGYTLWSTDGTAAGTALVKSGLRFSGPATAVGNAMLFATHDDEHGRELWISHGTEESTRLLRDLLPGNRGNAAQVTRAGDRVYFTAPNENCSDSLVSIDTHTGEVEVPLEGGEFMVARHSSALQDALLLGRRMTFFAFDVPTGIYSSNGNAAATQLIREVNSWTIWRRKRHSYFAESNDLYSLDRNGADVHPIVSDVRVVDVEEYGAGLLFVSEHPTALWARSGTPQTTRRILSFDAARYVSSSLTVIGEIAYFATTDGAAITTLWRTDGTAQGTNALHLFSDSIAANWPRDFVAMRSDLFFTAKDALFGRELWRVDRDDVVMVRDVNPGPGDGAGSLAAANDRIYFVGSDANHGAEPWITDGTSAGTSLLRDVAPGPASSMTLSENPLTVVGGGLIFAANDGESGIEPWGSNGTELGTRQLQDIAPGPQGSGPMDFTPAGSKIYFDADDGLHGRELWQIAASAVGSMCTGDCDGSYEVTVDEIVRSVALALAPESAATCSAADAANDGAVTVDDILLGIANLLKGCP